MTVLDFIWAIFASAIGVILASYLMQWVDALRRLSYRRKRSKSK